MQNIQKGKEYEAEDARDLFCCAMFGDYNGFESRVNSNQFTQDQLIVTRADLYEEICSPYDNFGNQDVMMSCFEYITSFLYDS